MLEGMGAVESRSNRRGCGRESSVYHGLFGLKNCQLSVTAGVSRGRIEPQAMAGKEQNMVRSRLVPAILEGDGTQYKMQEKERK